MLWNFYIHSVSTPPIQVTDVDLSNQATPIWPMQLPVSVLGCDIIIGRRAIMWSLAPSEGQATGKAYFRC